MVDKETIRTAIGIIGNIISLCLFLSPIPTFRKIIKQKAVQDFKADPYIATMLNCAMWSFYGLPIVKENTILVTTINSAGLLIELTYVIIFFFFSPDHKRRKISTALAIEVIVLTTVILIALVAFSSTKKRALFVGIFCVILAIIMYASPLTVMRMVIRTKSVKYMPICISLATLMNGVIWIIYAILRFDINIVIPNCLGAISGGIQIILYATYYRTTQWGDEAVDPSKDKDKDKPLEVDVELASADVHTDA